MTLPRFTWTTRARPFLEVGVGDTRLPTGLARWDVARWDDPAATWASTEPTFLDVSCEAFAVRCEYGRPRSTDRFVPGVATVEVSNVSGWADPYATVDPAALGMRPGRAIRFGVDHVELGRVVLWRGFIDAVVPTYDPRDPDRVRLDCVDALGEVNRTKLAAQAESPAGQTVTDRATSLLDDAAWPPSKRKLDLMNAPLVAATLDGQVADLLGRAADSGGGSVFGDREGNVVLRQRDWQTWVPGTPVAATIGNVDPADVCPTSWTRPFARADIATRVIMGRDAATAVVVDDIDGQTLYGIEPYERVDLWTQNDGHLVRLAERALEVRSWATAPVVRGVTLNARTSDGALDLMTSADPYEPSHYRCRLQYPDRLVFDGRYFVTGIVHELTATQWECWLTLDGADPYAAAGGRWDGAYWDRSTWVDPSALHAAARRLLQEVTA